MIPSLRIYPALKIVCQNIKCWIKVDSKKITILNFEHEKNYIRWKFDLGFCDWPFKIKT